MKFRPQKYAAGIRQRRRGRWQIVAQFIEAAALVVVHWMGGVVGTGKVAHDVVEGDTVQPVGRTREVFRFGRCQAEAVHAGVQRENSRPAIGAPARPVTGAPAMRAPQGNIARRVQNRCEAVRRKFSSRVAGHHAIENIYRRTRSDRLSQRDAFIDGGDEELRAAGGMESCADLRQPQSVAVRLDDGSAHARGGDRRQGAPVVGDRVQVDGQDGAGIAGCFCR